ncbi:MAG: magnesium chelatase domain-containing protein [Phycisphaerae bacterium]
MLHGPGVPGQVVRRRADLRRPRDQGRDARGAEDHRAHRRHRRLLRGRPVPLAPHREVREEPLRLDARGRPVRDDRRRAQGGHRPREPLHGNLRPRRPAIDLAIALAIASAHSNRPLSAGTLAIGELGLGGEVRSVPQLEQRLKEASRMGLGHAICPALGGSATPKLGGMSLLEVRRLGQAMAAV